MLCYDISNHTSIFISMERMPYMAKYKTLLFDLDDTLLDFSLTERDAFFSSVSEFGLPDDEKSYQTYHEINRLLWVKLAEGRIGRDELLVKRFADFCTTLGRDDCDTKALARFYESKLGENVYYIDGANEVLKELSSECNMYIVTNGTAYAQRRRLSRCEFMAFVSGVYISQEIGAEKPSTEFFDIVSQKVPGFDRKETLLIGDSLVSDIRGGNRYGIDTCLFDLRKEKKSYGDDIPKYRIESLYEIPALIVASVL